MPDHELLTALEPLLAFTKTLDLRDKSAADKLTARFPLHSDQVKEIRRLLRAGIEAGTLCDRQAGGISFSRPKKAQGDDDLSVDVVHMDKAGPGHTHPTGEVSLCFAVAGAPTFDGGGERFVVYPPGSWHIPTVKGGVMDIVYFLPGGQMRFEDKPR